MLLINALYNTDIAMPCQSLNKPAQDLDGLPIMMMMMMMMEQEPSELCRTHSTTVTGEFLLISMSDHACVWALLSNRSDVEGNVSPVHLEGSTSVDQSLSNLEGPSSETIHTSNANEAESMKTGLSKTRSRTASSHAYEPINLTLDDDGDMTTNFQYGTVTGRCSGQGEEYQVKT